MTVPQRYPEIPRDTQRYPEIPRDLSRRAAAGRSPADILGSNPTGGVNICVLWVSCFVRYRSLRRADHSSRGVLPAVVRRCGWSRIIKNGCSIYISIYIYDISSLRVNNLTLILLTWRKWWVPNNASKQQMGFNSAFKGLTQSYFPQSHAHVEFCAKRNWVWYVQLYLCIQGSPVSIKKCNTMEPDRPQIGHIHSLPHPRGLCCRPAVFFCHLRLIPERKFSVRVSKVISCQCFCF